MRILLTSTVSSKDDQAKMAVMPSMVTSSTVYVSNLIYSSEACSAQLLSLSSGSESN